MKKASAVVWATLGLSGVVLAFAHPIDFSSVVHASTICRSNPFKIDSELPDGSVESTQAIVLAHTRLDPETLEFPGTLDLHVTLSVKLQPEGNHESTATPLNARRRVVAEYAEGLWRVLGDLNPKLILHLAQADVRPEQPQAVSAAGRAQWSIGPSKAQTYRGWIELVGRPSRLEDSTSQVSFVLNWPDRVPIRFVVHERVTSTVWNWLVAILSAMVSAVGILTFFKRDKTENDQPNDQDGAPTGLVMPGDADFRLPGE